MTLQITLENLLPIIAGVAILIQPKWFPQIVAIYLIIIGVVGLTGFSF